MSTIPSFPRSGSADFCGHHASYDYDPAMDAYYVHYMGERRVFRASDFATDPDIARRWCEAIYQAKGNNYGVSGQSTQANAGSSIGSFSGASQLAYLQQSRQHQFNHQLNNAYQQQAAATYAALAKQQQWLAQQQLAAAQQAQAPAAKSEPLKTEGFKVGEIIGWRGWKITPTGFLRSMSADVLWPPDEPMEGKTKTREEHNGVYAFKACKDFLKQMENAGLEVYGRVALWGDVIEHELGYRAEYAKVVSLDHFLVSPAPHKLSIKDLRDRYCPVSP
jgi:hypothetical protein